MLIPEIYTSIIYDAITIANACKRELYVSNYFAKRKLSASFVIDEIS